MKDALTPEDMSNLFVSFVIPTKLYSRWKTYAKDTHQTMKGALAELLHRCSPGTYYHSIPEGNRVVVLTQQRRIYAV